MILVILESPYAGEVETNLAYARACMRDCFMRGEAPFASHLLYAANNVFQERTVSVALTKGLHAIIDAGDAERVGAFKWLAIGPPGREYAARNVRAPGGKQKTVYMHRFLLDAEQGWEVDHRNGDRLNNRRSNLRIASHTENARNTPVRSDNTTGFKGVSHNPCGTWRAVIKINGKQVCLGTFDTPEDAARAYDVSACANYGRFARVNFQIAGCLDDTVPEERAMGIDAGLLWGANAVKTVVYTDRGLSRGMKYGIANAEAAGRPVEYRALPGWKP